MMKQIKDFTEQEINDALDTIHDTSLQTSDNPFLYLVYDLEKQKELFEIAKQNYKKTFTINNNTISLTKTEAAHLLIMLHDYVYDNNKIQD